MGYTINFSKSNFWRAEVCVNTGDVPDKIRGKSLVTVVKRVEFDRKGVSVLPAPNLRSVEETQELFKLAKWVKGKMEFVGYALRNRSTGFYYVYN